MVFKSMIFKYLETQSHRGHKRGVHWYLKCSNLVLSLFDYVGKMSGVDLKVFTPISLFVQLIWRESSFPKSLSFTFLQKFDKTFEIRGLIPFKGENLDDETYSVFLGFMPNTHLFSFG